VYTTAVCFVGSERAVYTAAVCFVGSSMAQKEHFDYKVISHNNVKLIFVKPMEVIL
jgi:hypothetical protein